MKDWAWLRERLAVRSEDGPNGCRIWMRARKPARVGHGREGYGLVEVFDKTWQAHRVAWMAEHETFLASTTLVLHSCDNPPCINPVHLRLGTHRDNMDDRIERGPKGESHGCSKLTEEHVRAIRALPKSVTNRAAAEMFGVTSGAVSGIRTGRNWRSV